MKKFLLYGIPLLLVVGVGGYFGVRWKADFDDPRYGIGEQLNSSKTGSAVDLYLGLQEDDYLFIRDLKKSPNKPQFLCYMNYTSTQGSYEAWWSKDGQMIAVYNESALSFGGPEWVIGYDWQQGRVLHSQQILQAFARHMGKGLQHEYRQFRDLTSQEVEQFEPQKLDRDRPMP